MRGRALRLTGVSLGMMLVFTLLLGVLYPLVMTGASQAIFPGRADGSLVKLNGEVVGSKLAGQGFTSPAYFHSRPSATVPAYQPLPTTFENYGPNTVALRSSSTGMLPMRSSSRAPTRRGSGDGICRWT